jgi:hypothetical protein
MYRFVLLLPDDSPYDPPCLVTNVSDQDVGAEIELQNGDRARVLETDRAISTHLRALGFSGVLTVEPV